MAIIDDSSPLQQQQQQQQQRQQCEFDGEQKFAAPAGELLHLGALEQEAALSPVAQLFHQRSVFVTGASGFIGRVLLEKLLRCYQSIKRIYILLRPKKNIQPYERLHKHLLRAPIFDSIRALKNGQQLLDKIVVLSGDIGEHKLGMSEPDIRRLLNDQSLSVVFHSAASVKFDEPLKTSIKFNLQATKLIIDLCKRMPNLKCLCHVSTAYVNSDLRDQQIIEERLYPMSEQPEQVIKLAQLMDEPLLQKIKPDLVGQRPNTYTYTKALSEHLIALEASQLPVAIVRPSIVVASWREPLPGWIDNLNGPTGLILAIGKGLLRTMRAIRPCKADIIPVDIVVNTMIAAAHYTAQKHAAGLSSEAEQLQPLAALKACNGTKFANGTNENLPQKLTNGNSFSHDDSNLIDQNIHHHEQHDTKSSAKAIEDDQQCDKQPVESITSDYAEELHKPGNPRPSEPPIFHCTSGDVNPITWGLMEQLFWPIILKYPSQQVLRYPGGTFKQSKLTDFIVRIFVHYLPALFIDILCLMMGKKRQLLSIYHKLHRAVAALDNFCTTEYNFETKNLKLLQESLTHPLDRQQLYLDIGCLDWKSFWEDYVLGARRYVLKEEDATLPTARKSFQRARYLEYAIRAILLMMTVACAYPIVGPTIRQVTYDIYLGSPTNVN